MVSQPTASCGSAQRGAAENKGSGFGDAASIPSNGSVAKDFRWWYSLQFQGRVIALR